MIPLSTLLIGLGLGMGLAAWLQRNRRPTRDEAELADTEETLHLARSALGAARAELLLNERYTARLLDDPAYYVAERCGPPQKARP